MLRNDFGKLRIIAVDAKCMYCFTYCNVPQSKRSLWGYLWWWEENLKTSQYFVNIAVRRQHGKVRGWRRQGIRNQREQRPPLRGFWRQVMMERRSGLGSRSTLDCLGTRLVPAHFWRQVQKACTPHRLFRLGVIQRMKDILVFPVNHVFSILSNIIHTVCKYPKKKQWNLSAMPSQFGATFGDIIIPCIRIRSSCSYSVKYESHFQRCKFHFFFGTMHWYGHHQDRLYITACHRPPQQTIWCRWPRIMSFLKTGKLDWGKNVKPLHVASSL